MNGFGPFTQKECVVFSVGGIALGPHHTPSQWNGEAANLLLPVPNGPESWAERGRWEGLESRNPDPLRVLCDHERYLDFSGPLSSVE